MRRRSGRWQERSGVGASGLNRPGLSVSPELFPSAALYRALAECGIAPEKILHTAERLTSLPKSFHLSSWDPPGTESAIRLAVGFDRDAAARMLRLNEGRPDPEVSWTNLTRSERKRAESLWNGALKPDELNPRGRPAKIDSALVLYCVRVLCEASGNARFKFSRPPMLRGAPAGPMWRALIEALPPEYKDHAETIAEIVDDTRAMKFERSCQTLGLNLASSDIAEHSATFRIAISRARRSRPLKRRRT
jgi:hypothetical protein